MTCEDHVRTLEDSSERVRTVQEVGEEFRTHENMPGHVAISQGATETLSKDLFQCFAMSLTLSFHSDARQHASMWVMVIRYRLVLFI